MEKWQNQRAWFLVMPVVLLVAFNALIPLMTVVNYSVQDIFDSTHRLFVGTEWYRETLLNTRLQNALLRQLVFSGLVLLIELPLGVAIALTMPRKGGWAISATLVIIALPLLIPWNVIGTIWVVFFADGFLGPFQGFLYTLGVPVAAWAGIMLADIALRHHDYAEPELYDPSGRYGDVRWTGVILLVVGTALGWGLVTNTTTEILSWQGYLLDVVGLGGREGAWAGANLGVLVALAVGFVGGLVLDRGRVRAQES
jgi:ABC-type sugar transport system permease subunit